MPGARTTEETREPTAVLVIRAWRQGSPPVVAARISYTLDATTRDQTDVTASGIDEIGAVVERWLREVAGPDEGR